jgi:exopolysaccharide biosynthesis polyprenyl glycosylphosphotransferase
MRRIRQLSPTRTIPSPKRAFDVFFSCVSLLFLAPCMAAIALAICLDSPGAPLYVAERIGRNGRPFRCYKFRTMVQNAELLLQPLTCFNERDAILFKLSNDPRVTRIGRFLRKYSLDELPQLWNVLRGEMSLVGPRPPLSSEVRQYRPEHMVRLAVLPGLTGLWQVESRQNPSFDSYISLDTAYVENWSIWLDIRILFRTPGVVLRGTGS